MILALLGVVYAHPIGLSQASFSEGRLTLTFAEAELASIVPLEDLDAARIVLREATLDTVQVTAGGAPCRIGEAEVQRVDPDGIALRARVSCPAGDTWMYRAGFLERMREGHRHHVQQDGRSVAVLDAAEPSVVLDGRSDAWNVAGRFLVLGVEHIWTGYDHLLFLLALLLVARRARDMLLVVTGFTVAHSLTLGAAALGVLTPPAALVEPAIAASIVYVGFENFWDPPPRRRVVVTFVLGLIHGFGFAGLLAEAGIPHDARILALFTFNLGIEGGQTVIALLALPLLVWLRRTAWWSAHAVPALSLAVAAMGTYWLVERTLAAW